MHFLMSAFVPPFVFPFVHSLASLPALLFVPQPVTFPIPVPAPALSFPILRMMVVAMMFLPLFLAAANNKEGKHNDRK